MAKKGGLADSIMRLPWIVKVLLAFFLDIVFGIVRFIDGIIEHDALKAIVGFLWIFYGLGIGWLLDVIFTIINKRPLLF